VITHLDLVAGDFKTDFQQTKEHRGDTDDLNNGTYSSFHVATVEGVIPAKSGLTVGRIKTMMVKTPRMVPNGMNKHAIPAVTMQNV